MREVLAILAIFCYGVTMISCGLADDSPSLNDSNITFSLIDDPATQYEEVNIDIQGLRIHIGSEEEAEDEFDEGWINIAINRPGIQNILEFTGGAKFIIAEADIPAGFISKVRLILGQSNSVKIGDNIFTLTTPSAQQSGLKIKVNQNFEPGVEYEIKLDFEASRSIVETGSGKYILKPVIRVINEATSGSIKGKITPANLNIQATVMLKKEIITTSFAGSSKSSFLLAGVPAGTYDVIFDAGDASKIDPLTIEDVAVLNGESTDLGIISFQ